MNTAGKEKELEGEVERLREQLKQIICIFGYSILFSVFVITILYLKKSTHYRNWVSEFKRW